MDRARIVLLSTATAIALLWRSDAIADAPTGRYVFDASAGTVTDTKTKLTWLRDPITLAGAQRKLESAKVACPPGYRLPSIKEYETLVDESQTSAPLVDRTAFPGILAMDRYWSATESNTAATDYTSFLFLADGTTSLVYYNGATGAGTPGDRVLCVQP
ncbi:MAG: DUF1566 domain-containing protein [Polyangiales bacterium]